MTNATGLRRFVKQAAGGPAGVPPGLPPSIQEVLAARAAARSDAGGPESAERCEMCREVLGERHGHVVDLEKRSLSCTCRACYLLFTHEGAAGGRYRAVPEHVYHDPGRPLTDADWNELQIPVAMAFFFYNSALDRVVAGVPQPGRGDRVRAGPGRLGPAGRRPPAARHAGPRRRGHLRQPHGGRQC